MGKWCVRAAVDARRRPASACCIACMRLLSTTHSLDSFLSMNFFSSGGWTLGIVLHAPRAGAADLLLFPARSCCWAPAPPQPLCLQHALFGMMLLMFSRFSSTMMRREEMG